MSNGVRFRWAVLGALVLGAAGCTAEIAPGTGRAARAVEVALVAARGPRVQTQHTGSVVAFRKESIAFEVSGRLLRVEDTGTEVRGAVTDAAGQVVKAGSVVAEIDPSRYELARDEVKARVETARKELESQRIDLEQVAQADLARAKASLEVARREVDSAREATRAAQAQRKLALQTLDRERGLQAGGSSTEEALQAAKGAYDAADASLAQAQAGARAKEEGLASYEASVRSAEAALTLKAARIVTSQARIAELERALARAERDLEDCRLVAPFDGRITRVMAGRGTLVQAGQAILELTLFDPIKVNVALSGAEARKLAVGQAVEVRCARQPDLPPLPGMAYSLPEVADPRTRTFPVEILVRNPFERHEAADASAFVLRANLLPVMRLYVGGEGPLHIPERAIYTAGGKRYVLRAPGMRFGTGEDIDVSATWRPEPVEVLTGDERFMLLAQPMVSLRGETGLSEGEILLLEPDALFDEAGQLRTVRLEEGRYLLRPGDLATIGIGGEEGSEGLWVPEEALIARGSRNFVYKVEDGRAVEIAVVLGSSAAEFRQVRADRLEVGDAIVTAGRHFLVDGDEVLVTGEAVR